MNHRLLRWTPAAIFVIAGSTQSLGAGPFGATLELSSLNGTNGFVCNGIDPGDQSGAAVSGLGDFNGDGINDLVIGAKFGDRGIGANTGESYVVFGRVGLGSGGALNLSSLTGASGFVLRGDKAEDQSGISVSGIGDFNGDGRDDLIIGAALADNNHYAEGNRTGEAYVI